MNSKGSNTERRKNNPVTYERKRLIKFLCPVCYACYKFQNRDVHESYPKCPHCGKPLIRQKKNPGDQMKCLHCAMALNIPEGIWCLRFKGLVTKLIAKNCHDFVHKDIVQNKEGDQDVFSQNIRGPNPRIV